MCFDLWPEFLLRKTPSTQITNFQFQLPFTAAYFYCQSLTVFNTMMKACFLFLFLACTPTLLKSRDTYKVLEKPQRIINRTSSFFFFLGGGALYALGHLLRFSKSLSDSSRYGQAVEGRWWLKQEMERSFTAAMERAAMERAAMERAAMGGAAMDTTAMERDIASIQVSEAVLFCLFLIFYLKILILKD